MTDDQIWYTNNQNLTYRLNNGVPNQLTMYDLAVPANSRAGVHARSTRRNSGRSAA